MIFQRLDDEFRIICKSCGSEDIDLSAQDCKDCGIMINAECNKCGNEFNHHDFKKIEDDDGEVEDNVP